MGRPRTVSPEIVRAVRAWKPFGQVCKELGISRKVGQWARNYHFKTQYRKREA